ncbi:deoxyhypusine synthase [Xenococcus sp. PCC 7305]|uniref:deoxyhypusine synthase family protein n=1 Tax=Xenococcus sp. PCC 7305 TaxID=102125 RepID=UPI0002AD0AE0|nr:deoxyhypusine synthase family protein [Xenococcus sp. PCC 7305]ELS03887.1 deoxyhypusine synthase [Xenococcus sp. PCC 7305]
MLVNRKELKLLDLQQCDSVGEIVQGMNQCSFGARMLGEVTVKLSHWITQQNPPVTIYDGKLDSPLGKLLEEMVRRNWLAQIISQQDYVSTSIVPDKLIIIGAYSESFAAILSQRSQEVIFINQFGMALPGQLSDGYFPNVVFCDPKFVIPVIFTSLEEKLNGNKTKIVQFIREIEVYGGLAEEITKGADTLLAMVKDPECKVFLTLSGAMTIAKMGLIICDMVDLGIIDSICSTGALMAHGLVESVGLKHFKYDPNEDDANLADRKLNRVTDTLEPETNLDNIGKVITKIFAEYDEQQHLSPRLFHQIIGEYLAIQHPEERGILKSAYEQQVPVFVPAFHDSELGNDVYLDNYERKNKGRKPIIMNLELDTEFLVDMITNSPKIGIFTIGGGVPRNFIQNVPPLVEWLNESTGANLPERKFSYGCRICPDPMYYGHLSGCTYSEGMSWRKMDINGSFSEIRADATQIWPFLVKFVMESL